MLRRCLLPCAAWLLLAAPICAKQYVAERFDVDLEVRPGGSAAVTETVIFRFEGGPFTYVYRELALARLDGISDIRAAIDERPAEVEIRGRDPIRVTWRFAPVSDSTHTFVLSYRARGVVRVEESGDAIAWQAIPRKHDYRVLGGRIRLRYSPPAELVRGPRVEGGSARREEIGAGEVSFDLEPLKRNRAVTVSALFSRGSVVSMPPAWQARRIEQARRMREVVPLGFVTTALVFAGGVLLLLRLRGGVRRDTVDLPVGPVRVVPPLQLAPAVASRLVSGSQPAGLRALATLFDLAGRGVVRIEQMPRRSPFGPDFRIHLEAPEEARLPHEQGLLKVLFGEGSQTALSTRLRDFKRRIRRLDRDFEAPLRAEMTAAGLLDPRRLSTKHKTVGAGILLLLVGLACLIPALILGAQANREGSLATLRALAAAVGAGAGLALTGLSGIITGAVLSPLSDEGARSASMWKAFARYLNGVRRDREPESSPEIFERYLPYAVGFGFGAAWVKYFQRRRRLTAVPAWFQAVEAAGGADAAALAGIITVMSTGHGSAAGGAGGGASGGGASGAG
jgi:hypothetical protein